MNTSKSGTGRRCVKQTKNVAKLDSRDTYGDKLCKRKYNNNLRVIFQNINGFGTTDKSKKDELIKEFIEQYKIDIYGMS